MNTENLFTDGSEFKLPNGRRYRGYYHVHPTEGAMVGAVHVDRFHESLTPVNRLVKERMENRNTFTPPAPPRAPVVPPPIIQQETTRPTITRPTITRPTTTRPVTPTPAVRSMPTRGGSGGY